MAKKKNKMSRQKVMGVILGALAFTVVIGGQLSGSDLKTDVTDGGYNDGGGYDDNYPGFACSTTDITDTGSSWCAPCGDDTNGNGQYDPEEYMPGRDVCWSDGYGDNGSGSNGESIGGGWVCGPNYDVGTEQCQRCGDDLNGDGYYSDEEYKEKQCWTPADNYPNPDNNWICGEAYASGNQWCSECGNDTDRDGLADEDVRTDCWGNYDNGDYDNNGGEECNTVLKDFNGEEMECEVCVSESGQEYDKWCSTVDNMDPDHLNDNSDDHRNDDRGDLKDQLNNSGPDDKEWDFEAKRADRVIKKLKKMLNKIDKLIVKADKKGVSLDGASGVVSDTESNIQAIESLKRDLEELRSEHGSSIEKARSCVDALGTSDDWEASDECRKLIRYNETYWGVSDGLRQKLMCYDWSQSTLEFKREYFRLQIDLRGGTATGLSAIANMISDREDMIGDCLSETDVNYKTMLDAQREVYSALSSGDSRDVDYAMDDFRFAQDDLYDSDIFERDQDFWDSNPWRVFENFNRNFEQEGQEHRFEFEGINEAIAFTLEEVGRGQEMVKLLKGAPSYKSGSKFYECVNDLGSLAERVRTAFEGLKKKVDENPDEFMERGDVEEVLGGIMGTFDEKLTDNMRCIVEEGGDNLPSEFWDMMNDDRDDGGGSDDELAALRLELAQLREDFSTLAETMEEYRNNPVMGKIVEYQDAVPQEWMEATADIVETVEDLGLRKLLEKNAVGKKIARLIMPLMNQPVPPSVDRTAIKSALEDLARALESGDDAGAEEAVDKLIKFSGEIKTAQSGKLGLGDVNLFPEDGSDPIWGAEDIVLGLQQGFWSGYTAGDKKGDFGFGDKVLRDQFAKMITIPTGLATKGMNFPDDYTSRMEGAGWSTSNWGYDATRRDAFNMLFAALEAKGIVQEMACTEGYIIDVPCSDPDAGKMAALKAGGFVTGDGATGAFNLDRPLIRMEAAAVVMRAFKQTETRYASDEFDTMLQEMGNVKVGKGVPTGN